MERPGRPRKIDDVQKREVCALLSAGFTREKAAKYVGCTGKTLRAAGRCDPGFKLAMARAEMDHELAHHRSIGDASAKSWRASAWALQWREKVLAAEEARRAKRRKERFDPENPVHVCDALAKERRKESLRAWAASKAARQREQADYPNPESVPRNTGSAASASGNGSNARQNVP